MHEGAKKLTRNVLPGSLKPKLIKILYYLEVERGKDFEAESDWDFMKRGISGGYQSMNMKEEVVLRWLKKAGNDF